MPKKYSIHLDNDEPVSLLYHPQRPLDARIKSAGSTALMWILPGITGTVELAFLGGVVTIQKLMPPTVASQNELA